MRTNVDIDDVLMAEALARSDHPTKRATIDAALWLFVQIRRQADFKALRGKVTWEGDLDEMREGRFPDRS